MTDYTIGLLHYNTRKAVRIDMTELEDDELRKLPIIETGIPIDHETGKRITVDVLVWN